MEVGRFSDYKVAQFLETLNNTWLALHYDNPDVAGAYASEVTGGSYIRCKVSFSAPGNRATWSTTNAAWTGLPAISLTHLAAWDVQYNGNLLYSAPLAKPFRAKAGDRYDLPAGEIAISFR